MSDQLTKEFLRDTDNLAWDPPAKDIRASCYFNPETVEIALPSSATEYIESDRVENLSDWV